MATDYFSGTKCNTGCVSILCISDEVGVGVGVGAEDLANTADNTSI